ncbi:hypothetical protein CRUP_026695 [Coryphaenoides rupestris]|nr:hypothetical protein CRUP_026695 [Coryphaenoides rupestris]
MSSGARHRRPVYAQLSTPSNASGSITAGMHTVDMFFRSTWGRRGKRGRGGEEKGRERRGEGRGEEGVYLVVEVGRGGGEDAAVSVEHLALHLDGQTVQQRALGPGKTHLEQTPRRRGPRQSLHLGEAQLLLQEAHFLLPLLQAGLEQLHTGLLHAQLHLEEEADWSPWLSRSASVARCLSRRSDSSAAVRCSSARTTGSCCSSSSSPPVSSSLRWLATRELRRSWLSCLPRMSQPGRRPPAAAAGAGAPPTPGPTTDTDRKRRQPNITRTPKLSSTKATPSPQPDPTGPPPAATLAGGGGLGKRRPLRNLQTASSG